MSHPKKLIEVALPLDAINAASAREKSIRHGHPSTLHLWWARRPLAAARAVIFAQMVDDPSSRPELFPTEAAQEQERQRLFRIIEDLVLWENTTNETVLQAARDAIRESWRRTCADHAGHPQAAELFDPDRLPAFHDPFAGGGALPLEAQRLGLEAYASDLNPVAVLINKAMIEIPPKFAGRRPVDPEAQTGQLGTKTWKGAQGLAEDVRYYGKWMRDEAGKRIGHLYPKVKAVRQPDGTYRHATPDEVQSEIGNPQSKIQNLTVIAWLWARTVKSPNPAYAQVDVPLASTFMLSTKPGKEAWVEVLRAGSAGVPADESRGYRFVVRCRQDGGAPGEEAKNGTKLARGANFRCVMSGTPIAPDYIKSEGRAGRMGARLIAIVAEGDRGRVYLAPTPEHEAVAKSARPDWRPETPLPDDPRNFWTVQYGLTTYGDLFTPRQLVALTTFSDLVGEAMAKVRQDAESAGMAGNGRPLREGGTGAAAYAEAVGVYLAFAADKLATTSNSVCTWQTEPTRLVAAFSRQAIPMTWDYAEANAFGGAAGDYYFPVLSVNEVMLRFSADQVGLADQVDAAVQRVSTDKLVSTDPPYYDNIGYADLSDFFYVWLRRSLRPVFPGLFATVAVPKAEELVATPYRHGGKEKAEAFFLEGMTQAMHRLAEQAHPAFPVTIYYAFKQAETENAEGTSSTGWETFLDAVIRAGFDITGTWPMRTELTVALKKRFSVLASSIVLVCRKRADSASAATRREFVTALKRELGPALAHLQRGGIAPVDLAQAAIGPGMAVYTRYAQVLDAEGKPVPVREALALINQTLDEVLAEQEGDFDADTRWALAWFDQHGFAEGEYGVAETLSKAKNTSVAGMVEAGILAAKAGRVRLLRPDELPADWNPETDQRLTAWEVVHQLVRVLERGGEEASAALLARLGAKAEAARELAYRLYALCERRKRAAEALSYNALVQSWSEMARLVQTRPAPGPTQQELF